MILQALAAYYERLSRDGAVQATGFQEKEIPWVIEIDSAGRFTALLPTGAEGSRGRKFVVPAEVKKSVNIAANLLWENPEYVLGWPRPGLSEKQAAKVPLRHAAFVARLRDLPEPARSDPGVRAVMAFLEKGDFTALQSAEAWPEFSRGGGNVSFRLEGDDRLVCERPAVCRAVAEQASEPAANGQGTWCLVTGRRAPPTRLHPNIKGVRGARPSGAALVSFNRDAFSSYGWSQGMNAPVSASATHAYAAALNHLLSRGNDRHRLVEGDTTFVFWAAGKTAVVDQFAHLLGSYGMDERESDGTAVRETFESVRRGLRPHLDDATPFYVLGLAPNAARLAVRFWHEGTVAELARNIIKHFDDLEIVGFSGERRTPALWQLVGAAARDGDGRKLSDTLRGQLGTALMVAILQGQPYPMTLLARAVARCRAEAPKRDPQRHQRQSTQAIGGSAKVARRNQQDSFRMNLPIRAALIKATLKRRYSTKEVTVSLDPDETGAGYRLGRLFALLENIQRASARTDSERGGEAIGGDESMRRGQINVTIRDRFFGAMMTAPRSVFPHLMQLKNAHLKKLYRIRDKRGLAIFFEQQIDEILSAVPPSDGLPASLSLEEQGRFILGYHHQRSFRSGSRDVDAALAETSEPTSAE